MGILLFGDSEPRGSQLPSLGSQSRLISWETWLYIQADSPRSRMQRQGEHRANLESVERLSMSIDSIYSIVVV